MVPGACDLERVYMIMGNVDPPRSLEKCGLHPLIHTLLEPNLAQDIEKTTKLCGIIDAGAIYNLQ